MKRPIEPEMQVLWDRIDDVVGLLDGFVRILTGQQHGLTLMVHPIKEGFATISVSNLTNSIGAVREFIKVHDSGECSHPETEPLFPHPVSQEVG